MGKSSPSPPDPVRTVEAQAEANRINQFTPFGSMVFSGPDNNTATITLSPEQQGILNQLQAGQLGLGQRATGQIGGLPAGPIDPTATRDRAQQAFFDRQFALLDPIFQQQEGRLTQRLADQGIPQGSAAFRQDFGDFGRTRNRALEDLAAQSVIFGGQEAQRDVGFRQAGLQEIMAQLGLAQPAQPSFFGPGQVDVLGAQALNQQAQLANQQNRGDFFGGLLGLGGTLGAAAILSAREFKHNNKPVGQMLEKVQELPVERWEYLPNLSANGAGEHIGPYAEDFQAIFGVGDGRTINLGDAVGVCLATIKEMAARIEALERVDHG